VALWLVVLCCLLHSFSDDALLCSLPSFHLCSSCKVFSLLLFRFGGHFLHVSL
jgi:hypothetical protein